MNESNEFQVNMEAKPVKFPTKLRGYLNKQLQKEFGTTYFPSIPLKEIFDVLKKSYVVVVQEDGTPWSGFLMGDKGRDNFEMATLDNVSGDYIMIKDSVLVLTWYKMTSGKYEIVIYIS